MLSNTKLATVSFLLGITLFISLGQAWAQAEDAKYVHGDPKATKGGTLSTSVSTDPSTLHPLNAQDVTTSEIHSYIFESLLERDPQTLEYIPGLAKRWEISQDKLTYTFWLNEKARWQDGEPVTTKDVEFTFNAILDPSYNLNKGPRLRSYLWMIQEVKIIDQHQFQIIVSLDHFRNLFSISAAEIVPYHLFKDKDINKVMIRKPVGSGPYILNEWKKKNYVELKRNEDYWGKDLPQNRHAFNFDRIRFYVIEQEKIELEKLKKGTLSYMALSAKQWEMETDGPPFGTTVDKYSYANLQPKSYTYIGWKLEHPIFKDKLVRHAMAHLVDRDEMIEKIYFGHRTKAVGPFYHASKYASPNIKPIDYDPAKAFKLLAQAGWKDTDGDFILDKDGQKLSFTILSSGEMADKIFPLMQQTMKAGGVDVQLKKVDWNTLLKLITDYNFDAVMLGWSRTVDPDPTPLWHSKHAEPNGQNFVYFKNQEVDEILEQIKFSIPEEERLAKYRKLHEIIYEEQPYLFLIEAKQQFIAVNKNIQRGLHDYLNYSLGAKYWYLRKP